MGAETIPASERELLAAARRGDAAAFERLVAPHRGPLHAHCYRMLGSIHDADDALQEALLGAWRGLAGFEGRSPLRGWLYRIATNACLRLIARRPPRTLSIDRGPATGSVYELGEPLPEALWIEPYPDRDLGDGRAAPEARYEQRESVELAFVAALQQLPATQRAVLILREVLGFSARETAVALDTSVASVNSALQRARASVAARRPDRSQQATLRALGDARARALVTAFVDAWERQDVDAIVALLTDDVTFAMPPLPAWFAGAEAVGRFFAQRVFATPWRLEPMRAAGQLAVACHRAEAAGEPFALYAVDVLTVREDRISAITAFLSEELCARLHR